MSESIIRDNYFLMYSLILGISVTALYDLLRIFRRIVKHGNVLISLEDLFYWVVVAISVFYMMHTENNGTLRWFAILGAAVGMFLYKRLVSSIFVDAVSKLLLFILKYIGKVFRVIASPLRFVLGKCGKGVKNASNKGVRFLAYLKKKLTRCMKTLRMVLCKQ